MRNKFIYIAIFMLGMMMSFGIKAHAMPVTTNFIGSPITNGGQTLTDPLMTVNLLGNATFTSIASGVVIEANGDLEIFMDFVLTTLGTDFVSTFSFNNFVGYVEIETLINGVSDTLTTVVNLPAFTQIFASGGGTGTAATLYSIRLWFGNNDVPDAQMAIGYTTSTSVPEPAMLGLFGLGLIGFAQLMHRRRKQLQKL